MSEQESIALTSVDAQRIMDRDLAFGALKVAREKLSELKVRYAVLRSLGGIKGEEHPNAVFEALSRQEGIVRALVELCEKLEAVPEGSAYQPSDLTVVKGPVKP
jgi:hypothetical protein